MFRLLSYPDYAYSGAVSVTWLTGPNARSSGANTASDGSEQTFDTIGDVVSFRLEFTPKQGRVARRERGFLTALGGGTNAFRFTYVDADRMEPDEAGIIGPYGSQLWSNGKPWSNGQWWQPSYPVVPVAGASPYDSGIINLSDQVWGHTLGWGDHLGFFPFHFGIYTVTEVLDAGRYRIWPRLRKAVDVDDFCTLFPTLVVRPTGKEAGSWRRDASTTTDTSIDVVEVIDPYVRQYFSD